MRLPLPAVCTAMLLVLVSGIPAFSQSPTGVRSTPKIGGSGGLARLQEQQPPRPAGELLHTIVRQLELQDVPLDAALTVIAGKAGVRLGYTREILPEGRRVTLRAAETTLEEAFTRVLDGTGLVVVPVGSRQLALVRRPGGEPVGRGEESLVQLGVVTGRVTDAGTGAPLSGATVRLAAGRPGTLTRSDGRFRLEGVPAGTHALVASMIGYSPARREVAVQTGEAVESDFALAVSAVPLDQVIVTGTVTPTEVRAIPTPITIITADEIRERNVQRVDELFRGLVPGMISPGVGTSPQSEIRIRGSTTLTGTVGVKTYIDGFEVSSPTHIVHLDPTTIERIEIIRGPQASTIYGAGAIDGVIQIFTRRGRIGGGGPHLSGQAAVGLMERPYATGIASRQNYSIQAEGGTEWLTYSVGSSLRSTGDWQEDYGHRNLNLNGGARVTQGRLTLELTARQGNSEINSEWNPILKETGYTVFSRSPNETNYLDQETFGGTVGYRLTPGWSHTLTLGHDGTRLRRFGNAPRRTTPADTMIRIYAFTSATRSFSYSTSLELPTFGWIAAAVTGGADHNSTDSWVTTVTATSRTAGTIDGPHSLLRLPNENSGLFAQARVSAGDDLHLTAGVRADRNSNVGRDFGTAITPRIGMSYARQEGAVGAKLRLSYGEAIRPPSALHQQEMRAAGFHLLPNPELAPERQKGWDSGVDLYAGNWLTFGATYYDQTARDLIQSVVVQATTPPVQSQNQNVGSVRNSGWELEGRLRPLPGAVVAGTYSLLRSRVEQLSPTYSGELRVHDQLWAVPDHTATLSVSFALPIGTPLIEVTRFGPWRALDYVSFYGFLYGGHPYRGSTRAYYVEYPAFTKVNAMISRSFTPHLGGFLRIDNVTADRSFEWINVVPAEGRTVTLGLRFAP